jgi:hypothetical protein
MPRFVPDEALFKGRHFDGQIIILFVSWYTSFKLSLRGFGHHDGGPRHHADAHHDSALAPALSVGIREALEPVWSSDWRIPSISATEDPQLRRWQTRLHRSSPTELPWHQITLCVAEVQNRFSQNPI